MIHCHSEYSPLDGLARVEEIAERQLELGYPFVSVTDHASISAMTEVFVESEKRHLKPIIGCEFYLVDDIEPDKNEQRYHLTVLAKNWSGVKSIMKQLTLANQQFYKRPRLSFKQALDFQDCIISSACCVGILSRPNYQSLATQFVRQYKNDFFLELMPHVVMDSKQPGKDLQKIVNVRAIFLNLRQNIPLIFTNDSHYAYPSDANTHDILMSVQYNKKIEDTASNSKFYIKSMAEMKESLDALKYIPTACISSAAYNIYKIYSQINIHMPSFSVKLPQIYEDDMEALKNALTIGWQKKILSKMNRDIYHKRLMHEIGIIRKLGFVRYFLIVKDIVDWANANGIMVGPGRGSAAGSLVCYLLGITQVDPIEFGLYFERFLNPDRIDLPDIDIDFQDNRRHEVFDYIKNKYGQEYTGHINTYSRMGLKGAFRDVCRVYGKHILEVNQLSTQIEDAESFDEVSALRSFYNKSDDNKKIVDVAIKLDGIIRQCGIHAAGMIISANPLLESGVLERRKGDTFVVNWDKRQCKKFGLLKMDILGLTTLSMLSYAKKLVKDKTGKSINFNKIPLDDRKTLDLFNSGKTLGCFQFESESIQSLLKDLKITRFLDIVDATALHRPGSMNSGQTSRYVKVTSGHTLEDYLCHELKPILAKTKGVMIYQEQIMQIFSQLGGFTWAESDTMRKIISDSAGKTEFNKYREKFIAGCKNNSISEYIAKRLFGEMAEFAEYSFNKSHAVSYTLLSFWCGYLKAHYPLEFYAASLSFASEEKAIELIEEATFENFHVRMPDINISFQNYTVQDGQICAPLGTIKGVGEKAVNEILRVRKLLDPPVYRSLEHFTDSIAKRICNIRIRERLVQAGAFESLGVKESDKIERDKQLKEFLSIYVDLPMIPETGNKVNEGQYALFISKISECSKRNEKNLMRPKRFSNAAPIMVINNPVKSETENLKDRGTRHLLTIFKKFGLRQKLLYYTSVFKCHSDINKVPKFCQDTCLEHLRDEINAVQPKLILCCSAQATQVFEPGKKKSKINNRILFNKEFDCYVFFSHSPQYAFYQMEKVGDVFEKNIKKISKMINK